MYDLSKPCTFTWPPNHQWDSGHQYTLFVFENNNLLGEGISNFPDCYALVCPKCTEVWSRIIGPWYGSFIVRSMCCARCQVRRTNMDIRYSASAYSLLNAENQWWICEWSQEILKRDLIVLMEYFS